MVKLRNPLILLKFKPKFYGIKKWKSQDFSHTVFSVCDNVEKADVEKYKYVVKLFGLFALRHELISS